MTRMTSKDTSKNLKNEAKVTEQPKQGFLLLRTCPDSLHAGGLLTFKLADVDMLMIKKYGRWSSDTFLTHAHE